MFVYGRFIVCLLFCVLLTPTFEAGEKNRNNWETSPEIRRSIDKGLKHMAQNQAKDGSWKANGQYGMAMTSLSALAFLSAGHTIERGQYRKNVEKATAYVLRYCNRTVLKKLNGLITTPNEGRPMYGHGFAMLYLAQLYGTSSNPEINKRISDALRYGVQLISRSQSREGGWYYNPGDQHDEGSVTITQIQALRAAQNVGVTVKKSVIDEALKYLKKCQNPDGGIKYSLSSGGGSRPSLAAAGLACFYNCGVYEGKSVDLLSKYLRKYFKFDKTRKTVSIPNDRAHFMYTQHYASQAIFFQGGYFWEGYYKMISKHLLKIQNSSGSWSGSASGGDTFGTAVSVMILSLPYRYLPINQR